MPYDILVLGATGYTGRLIVRYLYAHQQYRTSFTLAIAGRSQAKLDALIKEEKLDDSVQVLTVDVLKPDEIDRAVKHAKVVINTVGPFAKWGTPVVRSCVENNVHYVDISGEGFWILDIINEFHDRARQQGTILVPASGFDCVPSDYNAYLAHKALKSFAPEASLAETVSAFVFKSGFSGGSLATSFNMLELPKEKLKVSQADWALSPVKGRPAPHFQLSYRLPHISPPVYGGQFMMSMVNRPIVQRTWGLLQEGDPAAAYGPNFKYIEFARTDSWLGGVLLSLQLAIAGFLLSLRPIRALAKRFLPAPGEGPSKDDIEGGYFNITTVATSDPLPNGKPPVRVKSYFAGKGNGYQVTAVTTSEAALAILLDHDKLPALGKKGGILTPVAAFGDVLLDRLRPTGSFEEKVELLEDRKAV
ncbi:Saccharopine dehydrogenase-domain-containing protein [Schizophyllum commune]